MQLTSREGRAEDFAAFYQACFYGDRNNAGLKHRVGAEWNALLENPNTITMVVEDGARPVSERLVGCAQMAFVTEAFVQWAKSVCVPGLYGQLIQPLPDGSWPLLTREEVAAGNAGAGLNAVFTRWHRADWTLTVEEMPVVGKFQHDAFKALTDGYRFQELLIEAVGEAFRDQALWAGFLLRSSDTAHNQSVSRQSSKRAFLLGITRAEACEREGSVMSHYFFSKTPRFGFSAKEQEILCLCLRLPDATNAKLAEVLGRNLDGVKNEWQSIYRRVEKAAPELLPSAQGVGRGAEKRRLLLQYLRSHPEELRPYRVSKQKP